MRIPIHGDCHVSTPRSRSQPSGGRAESPFPPNARRDSARHTPHEWLTVECVHSTTAPPQSESVDDRPHAVGWVPNAFCPPRNFPD